VRGQAIETSVRGPVGELWLDRPAARNAMGPEFFAELPQAVAELGADPEVRVILLAARGPDFSVGLDLKAFAGLLAGPRSDVEDQGRRGSPAQRAARVREQILRLQQSISAVADCPKPVVAAIHGWCIGGGVDLVAACDIRVASADARFSVRETRMAIVADLGSLQRLPRIIGAGHVAELVYTGDDIDATHAQRIGLVNSVGPSPEAAIDEARRIADRIAQNSPLAVQGAKAVLRACEHKTTAEGLDYVALWNTAFLESEDLAEAVRSFLEHRPPRFHGR
jgi:enoyl-CoA hydratase